MLQLTYTDATAQGLQPDQIILTDTESKQEHIRYSSLADLFPGTPLYNAHTTGTDVLWAGLPMITLPLEKMATRVAGSLCLATGLGDEMIVSSMKEYEEKAVSLALNRPKLQDLTNRLKAHELLGIWSVLTLRCGISIASASILNTLKCLRTIPSFLLTAKCRKKERTRSRKP
ncbi:hypothetical protein FXO37_05873 [Capsicum annuum]|nr:hypothetical protein FXO37_05873 [Capsicum annuum]